MKQFLWLMSLLLGLASSVGGGENKLPKPLLTGLKNPESVAVGNDGRIYITEIGWPTAIGQPSTGDSRQWTEAQQAQNITSFFGWARHTDYIKLAVYFNYVDYGSNTWYGIERSNRSHKPGFAALAEAGISSVIAEFDGEGDSGQIGDINAYVGDAPAPFPETRVTLQRTSWGGDAVSIIDEPLAQAVETLCYDYLEQEHGGWENNDGAFGTFHFNVAERTIELEFNGRYTDIASHNHSF